MLLNVKTRRWTRLESGDSSLCGIPKRKSSAVLAGRIKQGRFEIYTG